MSKHTSKSFQVSSDLNQENVVSLIEWLLEGKRLERAVDQQTLITAVTLALRLSCETNNFVIFRKQYVESMIALRLYGERSKSPLYSALYKLA